MREHLEVEILVVGGGPAGLAAAAAASSKGRSVAMVDENPHAGGQIWRQMATTPNTKVQQWLAMMASERVQILAPATVFDFDTDDTACIGSPVGHCRIRFQRAILCTGARELFLPFPGWTLPGVSGVGGLQALVKQGMPIRGKRVVVSGSGPLLPEVAKHLARSSARIAGIFEQAPPRRLRKMTLSLWRYPSKLAQALSFVGTAPKLRPGWWVSDALGDGRVEAVQVTNGTHSKQIECDFLACAFGLFPNTELAQVAGCSLVNGFVAVDEFQRTSRECIHCAGEPVEIGGVDAAIAQGTIAGLAAAGDEDGARRAFPMREKAHAFARLLDRTFSIREEVFKLAHDETILCRCEDVRLGEASKYRSFREAKLQSRVGMGPCQGRICGAACRALFGWEAPTVRPPVVPVPLEALVGE